MNRAQILSAQFNFTYEASINVECFIIIQNTSLVHNCVGIGKQYTIFKSINSTSSSDEEVPMVMVISGRHNSDSLTEGKP